MMPALKSTRQYKWQVAPWGRCGFESLASYLMLWQVLCCGIEESNSTASEDLHETRSDLDSLRRRRPHFARRRGAAAEVPRARSGLWQRRRGELDRRIAMLHVSDVDIRDVLAHVQNDLFDLGGDLCRPEREHRKVEPLRVSERQVRWIEERVDAFNAALAPLDSFVLPGGRPAAAHLHHARTVVRRAERYMTEIAYQEPVNPAALKYANRLSDLLFVLARYLNEKGQADVLWRPGLHR